MNSRAFVGLGSNLDNPTQQLKKACAELDEHDHISLEKCSSWYGSIAIGPGDQPDYVNAVAELSTSLSPLELLAGLQAVESAHLRVRNERWAPRTLDLDLLWFDGKTIELPELQVPHPRISERNFVLFPFREIAPDIIISGTDSVNELSKRVSTEGIWKI